MVLTKEEFRKRWEDGGRPVTYDDIADCAKAWGLYDNPRCFPMFEVENAVVRAAGCFAKERGWHKWPEEKPRKTGEYLVRGIGGLNNRLHYWVCLWIEKPKDLRGLYYGGNLFNEVPTNEFEWIDVKEL